jgi:hypothetical protein
MPIDLRPRGQEPEAKEPPGKSRVFFDAGLAEVFRKLCRYQNRTSDQMLEDLIRLWVTERAPQLELVADDEPAAKGEGERRTAERRGTKKPVPGSSHEKLNRRKEQRRKA